MKFFLTGATGYVGHELALALARRGDLVHILVRDINSANIPGHPNIKVFKGDITNYASIHAAMSGCSQVYHTAALVKLFDRHRAAFYKINVDGTNNVLAAAVECGVERFVFTSTCGVLGNSVTMPKSENDPRTTGFNNEYEFTKSLAEGLVKEYGQKGLHTVTVALSKVFGPGIATHPITVNNAINRFLRGKPTFIPRPGSYVSNYCFMRDVVAGHQLAMTFGRSGEKYILGGDNISYKDLFATIRALSGTKALLIETPRRIVQLWTILQWIKYKLTGREPIATLSGVRHIFCNKMFTSEKAIRELQYHITPLEEALKETIVYLKANSNG